MKKLNEKIKLSPTEKKKYLLPTKTDFKILDKCKQLEKLKLNKEDKFLVKFIKTQLEADWRTPLINQLNKLLRKYQ